MSHAPHEHRETVRFPGVDHRADVETAPQERAVDPADGDAVAVDLGLPVDAVEGEPEPPPAIRLRHLESGAIPEIIVREERLRNLGLLVADARIGNRPVAEVAGQDRARYDGGQPGGVVETGTGDRLGWTSTNIAFWTFQEPPDMTNAPSSRAAKGGARRLRRTRRTQDLELF